MSIDAKIRQVEETPEGMVLHLEPRRASDGQWSNVGQKTLTIEQPTTWMPSYGMAVWGGSDCVIVETGTEQRHYRRQGYTRLREAFRQGVTA